MNNSTLLVNSFDTNIQIETLIIHQTNLCIEHTVHIAYEEKKNTRIKERRKKHISLIHLRQKHLSCSFYVIAKNTKTSRL